MLIPKIFKELQLSIRKKILIKNWEKDLVDIFQIKNKNRQQEYENRLNINYLGNASQYHYQYHLTPIRIAVIKKSLDIIIVGKGVEEKVLLYTLAGNIDWCSPCRQQYGGS